MSEAVRVASRPPVEDALLKSIAAAKITGRTGKVLPAVVSALQARSAAPFRPPGL